MKTIFSFTIFCFLIFGKFIGSDAAALTEKFFERDSSTERTCELQYLKNEKLEIDVLLSKEFANCDLMWSYLHELLRTELTKFVEEKLPNEADCIMMEISKRDEISDRFLATLAIRGERDNLPESIKKTLLTKYQNEVEKDLKQISIECHIQEDNILPLFQAAFAHNETAVVLETVYCLTKYVTDRNILCLPNVNLNPHNIDAASLDCDEVMEEEMRKDEEYFRKSITIRDELAIACIMDMYKEKRIFDLDFASMVLAKLELPIKAKDIEHKKIGEKRAIFAEPFLDCYMKDEDFRTNPGKY